MQFTVIPPGFELSSIHEELSLNQFNFPLSNVPPSFWEVTDRSVARKVTLFLKWKCIIWKGATRTSLLNRRTDCFRTCFCQAKAKVIITIQLAQRGHLLVMGGRAVWCQGREGRMMRKSFQHSGFLPVLCLALLES